MERKKLIVANVEIAMQIAGGQLFGALNPRFHLSRDLRKPSNIHEETTAGAEFAAQVTR
jgi:hypothetical protein